MYTIDTIPMTDYGLYISNNEGPAHLLEPENQFFTIYGAEGYQITKRKANILTLNGFVIGSDLNDFKSKLSALYALFSSAGLRSIVLEASAINCFCVEGFKVSNVRIAGNMFAAFSINLTIV